MIVIEQDMLYLPLEYTQFMSLNLYNGVFYNFDDHA